MNYMHLLYYHILDNKEESKGKIVILIKTLLPSHDVVNKEKYCSVMKGGRLLFTYDEKAGLYGFCVLCLNQTQLTEPNWLLKL